MTPTPPKKKSSGLRSGDFGGHGSSVLLDIRRSLTIGHTSVIGVYCNAKTNRLNGNFFHIVSGLTQ